MSTKTIILTVPSTFQMPTFLSQAPPEQVEQVLCLADAFLEKGNHMTDGISQDKYRDEAIRIVKHQQKSEVDMYKRLLEEKNQTIQELKYDKHDLHKKLDTKDYELKEERKIFFQKLEEKESKNNEIQEKLQQRIAIQSNSSKRGLEGEKDFDMLTSNMKSWILQPVGKTKESADFCSVIQNIEVRFEVKNHESIVPYSKNVDKFERDMKQHTNTKIGIFVAMRAGIEKFDESISMKWTDEKQLLVFIPYFLTRDQTYTYDLIENLIRTMKHWKPYFETRDTSKDVELLMEKITTTIANIQILDKQIQTMTLEHSTFNTKMEANYKALQSIVCSTLSALTGKEQEESKKQQRKKKKADEA